MPEFFERYGTEVKCQAALQAARGDVPESVERVS
jgi:hypothetical protein